MGAVSVFTNGELHPSTTVKAAFRDISTTTGMYNKEMQNAMYIRKGRPALFKSLREVAFFSPGRDNILGEGRGVMVPIKDPLV